MAVAFALTVALATGVTAAGAGDVAAPSVEMRNGKGVRVRLADFKGKVVLVKLWASWCPDCRESFPALDVLRRDYRQRGVEVLAVNLDEQRRDAEAFLKTQRHDLNVMFDPRARVLEAFGATGIPTAYLIDRRGMVRFSHDGYDATTDATYRREIDLLLTE